MSANNRKFIVRTGLVAGVIFGVLAMSSAQANTTGNVTRAAKPYPAPVQTAAPAVAKTTPAPAKFQIAVLANGPARSAAPARRSIYVHR
jgi:hypothetical protein